MWQSSTPSKPVKYSGDDCLLLLRMFEFSICSCDVSPCKESRRKKVVVANAVGSMLSRCATVSPVAVVLCAEVLCKNVV